MAKVSINGWSVTGWKAQALTFFVIAGTLIPWLEGVASLWNKIFGG